MLKLLMKLIILISAVAGGRLVYDKALDLPPFVLRRLEVTGNSGMSENSLLRVTGLEIGKSIYKQNLSYALSRIMKQPGVIGCTIERGVFSIIEVDINMAEPALLVNSDELNALSREGIVLPLQAGLPVLPIVSGMKVAGVKRYERLKDPDIAYALETYDALMAASSDLSARLSEINFGRDGVMRLYFSPAGTRILIDKSDIKNCIRRLAVLADSGMISDTTMLDLRFGPVTVASVTNAKVP
jgi:cell division septal protein FtsQ